MKRVTGFMAVFELKEKHELNSLAKDVCDQEEQRNYCKSNIVKQFRNVTLDV
jgi:hypothetical protein